MDPSPRTAVGRGGRRRGRTVPDAAVHLAENFIRIRAQAGRQPVALREVAATAGCSVRVLQHAFRRCRNTTPVAAIRQARLDAARQALARGEPGAATVGEVARRYGFTNPGRFARLYKAAFGLSPAEALRRCPAPLRASRRRHRPKPWCDAPGAAEHWTDFDTG